MLPQARFNLTNEIECERMHCVCKSNLKNKLCREFVARGGPVPWETAVDRQKRRVNRDGSASAACDERTNVAVFITQQESVFRKWWAAAEEKCSIGLVGRFVFSFASAKAPGPPSTANFGEAVVLPVAKNYFRVLLSLLGPHAPLPTNSALLEWRCSADAKNSVHRFRLKCFEATKSFSLG